MPNNTTSLQLASLSKLKCMMVLILRVMVDSTWETILPKHIMPLIPLLIENILTYARKLMCCIKNTVAQIRHLIYSTTPLQGKLPCFSVQPVIGRVAYVIFLQTLNLKSSLTVKKINLTFL